MSDVLVRETLSISVVRQGLTSEFLTANDFMIKVDVSKFIGKLRLVRSYYNIAGRCNPELAKRLIRKNSWKDSMILQNLMMESYIYLF